MLRGCPSCVAVHVIDFSERGESCTDTPVIRLLATLQYAAPGDIIEARLSDPREASTVRGICERKGLTFEESAEGGRTIIKIYKR